MSGKKTMAIIFNFQCTRNIISMTNKGNNDRVKKEVTKRVEMLNKTELNDANLIKAINMKVVSVATYAMNICRFTVAELKALDQIIKRELRGKGMLGRQASDEQLYLKRAKGGRGLKSLRDAYMETRLRAACYMAKSSNRWIRAAWEREQNKEERRRMQLYLSQFR